jgi:hypothetical protein
VQGETRTALDLAERIRREIDAARAEMKTLETHPLEKSPQKDRLF